MVRQYYRLFIVITLCSLISIITSWILYQYAQNRLTQQINQITQSTLAGVSPHTTFTFQERRPTGWPFGVWQRLSDVSFSTTLGHITIVGATPTLLIGGTWLDWAKSALTKAPLVLYMPDIFALRCLDLQTSLTARFTKTHLHLHQDDTASLSNAALYIGAFQFARGEFALSTSPESLTLIHASGTARIAPQARPAQALLSVALSSRSLTAPSDILHYISLEHIKAYFAVIPSTNTPPSAPANAPIILPPQSPSNMPSQAPFLWRFQELSARLRPLNAPYLPYPLPQAILSGTITTPARDGTLTLTLKNWRSALQMTVNSPWFHKITPPDITSFLQKGLHTPRMTDLTSHPLSVSLSIEHGTARGLSTKNMAEFYTTYLQPYLTQ